MTERRRNDKLSVEASFMVAGIYHFLAASQEGPENEPGMALLKICTALECDISDIMEVIDTDDKKQGNSSAR